MHSQWLSFKKINTKSFTETQFEFSISMLFTLNHDPENFRQKSWAASSLHSQNSLLPFPSISYARGRLTSTDFINRLQSLWLPVGFSQWEAHAGGQRAGAERSRGKCSLQVAGWLWVCSSVLCSYRRQSLMLCNPLLHDFSNSLPCIPDISLSRPFWLTGLFKVPHCF